LGRPVISSAFTTGGSGRCDPSLVATYSNSRMRAAASA
jgi:hypothetical protein